MRNHRAVACLWVLGLLAAALVAGCGGGGGGGSTDDVVTPAPPAFHDAARPEVAAYVGKYFGDNTDITTVNAFLLIDPSGRFLLWNRTGYSGQPYIQTAEDVVIGTLTFNGSQATSVGAQFSHRDAGVVASVSGTVNVAMSFGAATTAGLPVQVTLSQTVATPIASQIPMTSGNLGYWPPPFVVPEGSLEGGSVTISADGRVDGALAAGCTLVGSMSFTSPTVNIARMNATISGAGCAAVAYPVGSGEFMGYLFLGANAATGRSIGWIGIAGGRPLPLVWSYPLQ